MSALTTPDAWKELTQLLETRKQVLDNALVRTLDDKCPASYFQVVRSLMLDHEKMLHWFISQQNQATTQSIGSSTEAITKPSAITTSQTVRRAGFLRPGLLAVLAFILFFFLLFMAFLQRHIPFRSETRNTSNEPAAYNGIPQVLAHHLHFHQFDCDGLQLCSIMEKYHGPACHSATTGEMADAPPATRPANPHQNRIAPRHQDLPQPA